MLLGDNVITWQSRKCDPPVWAVNSSATVLSLCSHTTVSTPGFGRIVAADKSQTLLLISEGRQMGAFQIMHACEIILTIRVTVRKIKLELLRIKLGHFDTI